VSSQFCQTILPPAFETSDLSLAELIDIALQNNPSTKQTWAEARSRAAQYGQVLSSFYPSATAQVSYYRDKSTFISPLQPTPFYYTQGGPDFILSYTLFDFGQRTAAAMAAREALYYADFEHNQNVQVVIQGVMNDYYNYIYQLAEQQARQANLETAQSSLDAANEKFALGLAALGDVAQARTQFLQAKINLTSQKQQVENAFAQLAVDLGIPANLTFKVQPMPEQIEVDPSLETVEQLVQKAQEQRQDFQAAQAAVRAREALLLKSKRDVLPSIRANFDFGHYWFMGGFEEKHFHWTAILQTSFPLFQGFYYKNGIKKAQAEFQYSQASLLQLELAIVQSVTTAHMGVKTAAQNLADSNDYLKSAQMEFDIAISSYKAGTATILDVMSAQSALADARSKKANSQKDWFVSLAQIAYATGSLCSAPQEAPCDVE
jgi:outer membrane protein TolC